MSMVMLGTVKLLSGLLFGAAAMAWMRAFPMPVLAVFLSVAGIALICAGGFWQTRTGLVVATVTMGVYLASGILPAGFAAGWAAHALWTRTVERKFQAAQSVVPSRHAGK